MKFKCKKCKISFTRRNYLTKHLNKKHTKQNNVSPSNKKQLLECPFCLTYIERNKIHNHMSTDHHDIVTEFEKTCSINEKVCIFRKYLHSSPETLEGFCASKETVKSLFYLIQTQLIDRVAFRASIAVTANYEIPGLKEQMGTQPVKSIDEDSFTLRSKGQVFNQMQSNSIIKNRIKKMLKGAANRNEDLLHRGSGWRLVSLASCDVVLYQINLM